MNAAPTAERLLQKNQLHPQDNVQVIVSSLLERRNWKQSYPKVIYY